MHFHTYSISVPLSRENVFGHEDINVRFSMFHREVGVRDLDTGLPGRPVQTELV